MKESPQITTLDGLLQARGHQVKNYVIIGISSFLVTSFALTYIFLTAQLKYRCVIPECENPHNTSYITSWIKNAVPFNKDGSPQTCYRYAIQEAPPGGKYSCDHSTFDKNKLVKCNEWVFETNEVNLLNEFNLECDENKWKLALIGSLDGLGALFGSPICAFVSDKFGRKRALCLFSIICVVLGFIRSFSVDYIMYAILDFLNAFLDFGIFGTSFVLYSHNGFIIGVVQVVTSTIFHPMITGMELVSSRHRVFANIVFNVMGTLGYLFLGTVGVWVTQWRWLLRTLYANGLVFLLYFWIAPESVRWLLIKDRDAEAVEEVKALIKNDPKTKNINVEQLLLTTKKNDAEIVNVGYLKALKLTLRSWKLLIRLVHTSACWLGIVFLWYGSLQQSVSLSGDKHTNVIYSALAQIPGYAVSGFSIKWGHKITLLGSLALCSAVSITFYFLPAEYDTVRLILYMLSMTGVTSSYAVIYMSTVALFPTPLRQSLLAFCCMVGRLGQTSAPQVFQLGPDLPLLIFGCVALAVAALAMFLPETFHLELPDTIKQAENVGAEPIKHNGSDSS